MSRVWLILALLIAAVGAGSGIYFYQLSGIKEPASAGGPATFRRLGETQYKRSIDNIFGPGLEVPGRFDPPRREEGLLAVGNSQVVVSRAGFEQAELRARELASMILNDDRRNEVLTCTPKTSTTFDESCATAFVEKYGRLLYRRPLDASEMASVLAIIKSVTNNTGDFYRGVEAGLTRLLVSPHFLYRAEDISGKSREGNVAYLDDYSLASRISFLLWDAPPDEQLLNAAARGDLRDEETLQAEVDRMISSPKFRDGVRAFFSDMFAYEQFEILSKEQAIFPLYSSQLAKDAREQALRTIVDLLVDRQGDYRQLFTTRTTLVNRNLSALYQVRAPEEAVTGWAPYTFDEEDRRAGILTLAAFLMLDVTHEGRTSPTIRGQAVRELYLCQKVPPPPPAVDFKLVQDTQNPHHKTARQRLSVHAEVPTCAGCHAITDPIGLAMENYDGIGAYRETENGALIDASGTFEAKPYQNAIELQQLLSQSSAVTDCLAKRVYEYGVGRPVTAGEREWMAFLREQFAAGQYRVDALMRTIATSTAFRTVSLNDRSTKAVASN